MTHEDFILSSPYQAMTQAVIDRCGGWDDFAESAMDVANHGASDGTFGSFIYYTDTCEFFQNNRSTILRAFRDECEEIGEPMAQSLASFRCLNGDYPVGECESFLIGLEPDEDWTQLENALSWWALERVCNDFANYCHEEV